MHVDFKDFVTLVRNDILGLSQTAIPVKKMARELGLEDPSELQAGIEALTYVILHMAKVNATEEEFHLIYGASGLNQKPAFEQAMFDVVYAALTEVREVLDQENLSGIAKFRELDWRLSLVTANRSKQKIMEPKFTVKLDI